MRLLWHIKDSLYASSFGVGLPAEDKMTKRQKDENTPSYLAPLIGFRSRKAAQMCAFFALRSTFEGRPGMIEKLKLIKLLYLTERHSLTERHAPMLYDELFSLPHGPICSSALNGIDGRIHQDIWAKYLAHNGNVTVAVRDLSRADFDELSDVEIDYLEKTWKQFGRMTASELRNWSHENCQEYTEVGLGNRLAISYSDLLKAVGVESADAIDQEISDFRRAESALLG
jgi:uncharacterized phage-associated protein